MKIVIFDSDGGNTKIPTCAFDRVDTELNGCRPRITGFDRAITIYDTSDIGCRPRQHGC